VPKWILSSIKRRSTLKDSMKICFIFYRVLLYFLCILEVFMIFWNLKRNKETENSAHIAGPSLAHCLSLLDQPKGCFGLSARTGRRGNHAHAVAAGELVDVEQQQRWDRAPVG
jgi:hypothetical protein